MYVGDGTIQSSLYLHLSAKNYKFTWIIFENFFVCFGIVVSEVPL